MWFHAGSGRGIEIEMTMAQAIRASHLGDCNFDVKELATHPRIKTQLAKIDVKELRDELLDYGAWTDKELQNHEKNLETILWIAACDIREQVMRK